jgi:hypothetical protein
VPDEFIENYAECYILFDESEKAVYLLEHGDFYKKVYLDLLEKQPLAYPVEYYRINIRWATEDNEYNAIQNINATIERQLRDNYLKKHLTYAADRRRRDAYQIKFPEGLIDTYVEYYTLVDGIKAPTGSQRIAFMGQHMAFYEAGVALGLWEEIDFVQAGGGRLLQPY